MAKFLSDMVRHFEKNGLKVLGQGYHAAVFQAKQTNEVVKVFKNDSCYLQFLKLIAEHPDNKHFPRIKSHAALKGKYEGFHIVKMEKLNGLSDLGPDYELMGLIKSTQYYHQAKVPQDFGGDKSSVHKLKLDDISLYKAIELIVKNPNRKDICSLDIKTENVMRRDDGTIVIIDPYAVGGGF